jgi:hypothetical protein
MSRQTRIIKKKALRLFKTWLDLFREIEDINPTMPEGNKFSIEVKEKREE